MRSYGFQIDRELWANCDSIVVRVLCRENEKAESPINPRTDGESAIWDAPAATAGLALDGLIMRVYLSSDGKHVSGPHVYYTNVHHVDLALAERHAKTLRRIERRIAKVQATEAGDVLMAMAKAIGATWSVRQLDFHKGSTYTDHKWRFGELTEARDALRTEVETLRAKLVA